MEYPFQGRDGAAERRVATYAESPSAFWNWYRGRICRTDAALWKARSLCREQEADHGKVVAILEPTRM
jgi:hypothetical protein